MSTIRRCIFAAVFALLSTGELVALNSLYTKAHKLPQWWYATRQSFEGPQYWTANLKETDTVCYAGHRFSSDGNVKLSMPIAVQNLQIAKKVRLLPLLTPGGWANTSRFLKNEKARSFSIVSIVNELKKNPRWGGVHLDMEYVGPQHTGIWLEWLAQLKAALHKLPGNKVLSLAVFPPHDFKNHEMHPPARLALIVDEIVVMLYDYHGPSGNPGPVSEINWINKNLNRLLHYYRHDQIWAGLPLYGYGWVKKRTVVLSRTYGLASRKLSKYNFDYTWLPSDSFLEQAVNTATLLQLKGVAFWRAGFESKGGI